MPRKNPLSNGGRKKTLLCIDDQADGLVIRQKFLEQLRYSVLIAESGRAGLRLLSEQSIDLVVLDYRMPELDGSQVAAEIRRLYGRLPIVMLSGYPEDIPAQTLEILDAFVVKGEPANLVSAILRLAGEGMPQPYTPAQIQEFVDLSARQLELAREHSARAAEQAEHGEIILPGWVYVAPPDEHLLVGPGKLQLLHSQLVHFSRPSIDLLFESVAGTYGSRSVGLILSGSGLDGASGMAAIKESGGVTIVQNDAEFKALPQAALETHSVDLQVPLHKIAQTLPKLCCGNHKA